MIPKVNVINQSRRVSILAGDPLLPLSVPGLTLWTAAGCVSLAAGLAAPLATFVLLLGVFGLAHVLAELRYVDGRFTSRLSQTLWRTILAGVTLIAVVRAGQVAGLLPSLTAIAIEALVGLALAVLAAVQAERHSIAIGAGVALFAGLVLLSPFHALILVALLHNLTPLAFIAEARPASQRRALLLGLSVPFFVVPLLLATGWPRLLLADLGLGPILWYPPEAGAIERQLGAFLPPEFWRGPAALDLFAGAVFAQMMHYTAVILVLPRVAALAPEAPRPAVPWPSAALFWTGVAAASGALVLLYAVDYGLARGLYGLFAAVHSWLEVPLLVLLAAGALTPRG